MVLIDIATAATIIVGFLTLLRFTMRWFYERSVPLEQRKREEAEEKAERLAAEA